MNSQSILGNVLLRQCIGTKTPEEVIEALCTTLQYVNVGNIDEAIKTDMHYFKLDLAQDETIFVDQMLNEYPVTIRTRTSPDDLEEPTSEPNRLDEMEKRKQRAESIRKSRLNKKIKESKLKHKLKYMMDKFLEAKRIMTQLSSSIVLAEQKLLEKGDTKNDLNNANKNANSINSPDHRSDTNINYERSDNNQVGTYFPPIKCNTNKFVDRLNDNNLKTSVESKYDIGQTNIMFKKISSLDVQCTKSKRTTTTSKRKTKHEKESEYADLCNEVLDLSIKKRKCEEPADRQIQENHAKYYEYYGIQRIINTYELLNSPQIQFCPNPYYGLPLSTAWSNMMQKSINYIC